MKLSELLDRNKIIPFYKERKLDRGDELPPVAVELHWTSNCNYDCVHCSYGSRRESKGYLSKEIINQLLDDLINMGVQAVYLSGGGEPTVMAKWDSYAKKLIDNNIEVALITNQAAIKEKSFPVVREMNYVAVSVYSTHEDRYNEITDSNHFSEQFTLPAKLRKNKSGVIIGARCVLNKVNHNEIYEIYQTAIQAGFDYIIFIPAVDYEGNSVGLEHEFVEKIQNDIKRNMHLFDHDKTNVATLVQKKISHYKLEDYRDMLPVKPDGCKAIQMRSGVFVNYDGGIYLCQPDIGNEKYEIGSLLQNGFPHIWNSTRHIKVIEDLNKRYNQGNCKNCRSISFNRSIYQYDFNKQTPDLAIQLDPFL